MFHSWIAGFNMTHEDLIDILVFFDWRPQYGHMQLSEEIIDSVFALIRDHRRFLTTLAATTVLRTTPLSLFGGFVIERSGQHKNELNLKMSGLIPLIGAIRLLSLENGITETSTLGRLAELEARGVFSGAETDALVGAFEVVMLTRMRNRSEVGDDGPDNHVDIASLSVIQKAALKAAFKTIDKLQRSIRTRYML